MAHQAVKNKRSGSGNATKQSQMLGAKNVGASGGEDGITNYFSMEYKSRAVFVGNNFMKQAVSNNKDDKIPLVMIHTKGEKRINDLIMIRYQDWEKVCRPELYSPPRSPEKREVKELSNEEMNKIVLNDTNTIKMF